MSKPSRFKNALSFVLSAMMALPASSWAAANQDQQAISPAAKDGVGVITHEVIVNGQPATLVLASIPQEQVAEVTRNVVSQNAENTVLQVAGQDDLVYRSAAWTGREDDASVYVVAEDGKYPLMQSDQISESSKRGFLAKVRSFTQVVKERREAILWGLIYAGIQGAFVGISSGSISSGVTVMTALGFWNAFVSTRPDLWGRVMDAGGNVGLRIGRAIASLTGTEMSKVSRRAWQLAGKFATTLTFTTIQAAGVNGSAGNLDGWEKGMSGLVDDLASVSWSGIQNNYNIWDVWAVRNLSSGALSKYFKWQWILGGIFECFGYMNLGFVPFALASITGAGVLYLLMSPKVRERFHEGALKVNVNVRYGISTVVSGRFSDGESHPAKRAVSKIGKCTAALLSTIHSVRKGPGRLAHGGW